MPTAFNVIPSVDRRLEVGRPIRRDPERNAFLNHYLLPTIIVLITVIWLAVSSTGAPEPDPVEPPPHKPAQGFQYAPWARANPGSTDHSLQAWPVVRKASENSQPSAWQRSLTKARAAMADRDLNGARMHVEAAVSQARTPAERAEAARLKMLLAHVGRFWDMVRQGVAALETAEELITKDTQVLVVHAEADELTIRTEGANHSYRLRSLPAPLAMAVVEEKIPASPQRNAVCGAFWAMDRDGNRQQARRLWEAAIHAGLNVKELLPELDIPREVSRNAPVGQRKISPAGDWPVHRY